MIDDDTPLSDIAAYLSREAARTLDNADDPRVQEHVLANVRSVLKYWESTRFLLDPIAQAGALDALVGTLTPITMLTFELQDEVDQLRTLLSDDLLGG